MKQPKVTIIVPIYNVEKYLPRCMDSLLNQTLADIEIIMVDDESPDNCPAMCDEYAKQDDRIKVIHKKNGGLGFARNSGLEIATGEFVAFIDSDDFVDVNMYETLYNTAKEHNLDTVYCGVKRVSNDGKTILSSFTKFDKVKIFETQKQIKQVILGMVGAEINCPKDREYPMAVWRAIYSMSLIQDNAIRFCSEREFISEDMIFHIDYLPQTRKIAYLPDMLYFYRSNSESLTGVFKIGKFDKIKKLFDEVRRKLTLLYNTEEFSARVDRFYLGYTRVSVYKGVTKGISKNLIRKEIIHICHDKELQDILRYFPYHRLPLTQRILVFLIKYKLIRLIMMARKFAHTR